MEQTRINIANNVFLTYLPAKKFKTDVISAQFITPLRPETASAYALLPTLLRRGTVNYPDMGSLAAQLDRLYGARIDTSVRKIGERQCVGFVASAIDDHFAQDSLLEPLISLLGEMICAPVTMNGGFISDYFESEKTNLLDAIRSLINDKRSWAMNRLLCEMCAKEAYGIPRLGNEEQAQKIEADALFSQYRDMIASSRLELFYSGSAEQERIQQALLSMLSEIPREAMTSLEVTTPHPARAEVLRITDTMDVTQGKLEIGFSCGSDDYTALLLGNMLFGGSSNAKLFMNVREKLSLCYYASSVYHRQKRMITVSSGIEFQNFQRAQDEILAQLESIQKGELEDWELDSARAALLNFYAALGDSQGRLESFYIGQAASDLEETPEELSEKVRTITPERIFEAMRTVKLDTIYFLRGEENKG